MQSVKSTEQGQKKGEMRMYENRTVEEVCREFSVDLRTGLSAAEVEVRQRHYGENELREAPPRSLIVRIGAQLCDSLIFVLFAAAGISLLLGEYGDAGVILAVVVLNATVGVIQEGKAEKALESLKRMTQLEAVVIREGKEREIAARELVPGVLDAGRQVPADLRLTETAEMRAEESALTGESRAVEKNSHFLAAGALPVAERKNETFMTSYVTAGRGKGIVIATGMNTEVGRIASLIREAPEEETPLQKRLSDLGKLLSILTIGLCVLLFALAVWQKRDVMEMLLTAISLAVAAVPEGLPASITVLQKPLDHVYLAATSAMDLIAALGRVDRITLSGTKESGWYVDAARQAMEDGTLSYAGKYSAPDYEQILSSGCDLALESTMIYHVPDVKAQLEQLKIPVFVERSSYEEHPLGRMEWIRLYGVLFDAEETAEQLFQEQVQQLDTVLTGQSVGKSAAFFYITSNGAVNVRKPGDYVAKMIELAGGSYVPKTADTDENALSTMNMQMETFYAEAKEADCLIYNSTIEGELQTMDELLQKSPLLKDFKAVKSGNVWCTGKNMFQETMGLGDMILDLHAVLSEAAPDENSLHYLHRLK